MPLALVDQDVLPLLPDVQRHDARQPQSTGSVVGPLRTSVIPNVERVANHALTFQRGGELRAAHR
jgi:hypothetical protein